MYVYYGSVSYAALMLSALKAEGVPYSPAAVKRILENTATPLGRHDKFSIGQGVIQVRLSACTVCYIMPCMWNMQYTVFSCVSHFAYTWHDVHCKRIFTNKLMPFCWPKHSLLGMFHVYM